MALAQPPWPQAASHKKTYSAHCHCGDLRWTFELSSPLWLNTASTDIVDNAAERQQDESQQLYTVTKCSCSFCARHGILSVHPKAKNISFSSAGDDVQAIDNGLDDANDRSSEDPVKVERRVVYKTGCRLGEWWFCRRCGCVGGLRMGEESGVVDEDGDLRGLINIRMLDDFDEDRLTIKKSDIMKSVGPEYKIDSRT